MPGDAPSGPARTPDSGSTLGYLEVLGAATLWGSSGIFSVYLFRLGLTPETVALFRPLLGTLFLAALALVVRPAALRVERRGLLILLAVGGGATAIFQLAYQMAVETVGVPTTVALLYLAPAFVLLGAWPLLGERPSPARVALAAVSVVGVWLTVLGARGVDVTITPAGVAWGVLAGAGYASYTVFGRWASPRHGSMATVLWSYAGAFPILLVGLPLVGEAAALPRQAAAWGLLAAAGLFTIAIASYLFYDALGRIEAGRASISSTLEPVVAALLAALLLDQHLTPSGWVGLGLVVVGVAGAYRYGRAALPGEAVHG